jgi:hypothetical protein
MSSEKGKDGTKSDKPARKPNMVRLPSGIEVSHIGSEPCLSQLLTYPLAFRWRARKVKNDYRVVGASDGSVRLILMATWISNFPVAESASIWVSQMFLSLPCARKDRSLHSYYYNRCTDESRELLG